MGALVFAALQGALQLARFDPDAIAGIKMQLASLLGLAAATTHD